MIKLSSTGADVKVKIFNGNAAQVEKELSTFLEEKKVRIHGFAQSQSTLTNSAEVNVTATLLYSEYSGNATEERIGFNKQ